MLSPHQENLVTEQAFSKPPSVVFWAAIPVHPRLHLRASIFCLHFFKKEGKALSTILQSNESIRASGKTYFIFERSSFSRKRSLFLRSDHDTDVSALLLFSVSSSPSSNFDFVNSPPKWSDHFTLWPVFF